MTIASSEMIINADGSVFHLHLTPEELCDTVLLVGDPGRVGTVADYFDEVTLSRSSREFTTKKGLYKGHEIMVLSTGIGTDNIDIVVNELDALANIDFTTREIKESFRKLTIVRMGTCGAVQSDLEVGDIVLSNVSVGIDSLARFYSGINDVCDIDLEDKFIECMEWGGELSRPYAVHASCKLVEHFSLMAKQGITISAPGFYAPQGRQLRLRPIYKTFVDRLSEFEYGGLRINNIEMESSAIAALSAMLGHDALTMCTVIAQRKNKVSNASYQDAVNNMIVKTLDNIIKY